MGRHLTRIDYPHVAVAERSVLPRDLVTIVGKGDHSAGRTVIGRQDRGGDHELALVRMGACDNSVRPVFEGDHEVQFEVRSVIDPDATR
jgi:hypothetical protein